MPSIFQRTMALLTGDDYKVNTEWLKMPLSRNGKPLTERELLRRESEIGAELFGPLQAGGRRQFFNVDPTTWIWYEEWRDANGQQRSATTRYEVHKKGILKVQEGARYSYLDGQELQNLTTAIELYYNRVSREIYHVDPDTGRTILQPL